MSCGWQATALCPPGADAARAVQVLGIDVLQGCKGTSKRVLLFLRLLARVLAIPLTTPPACGTRLYDKAVVPTEPEKQFALVQRHIRRLREVRELVFSQVIIMVERNLGFEAEHHEHALNGLPHTRFRVDHAARRYGILTTEEVKYGMMTLFNNMLRDQRVAFREPLLSEDPPAARRRIQEQMKVYSFQYKQAVNCFGKQRVALCGKVGGMKDDVVIALQLAVYYSERPEMYA
jgi:hypothetical protein